MHVIVNRAALGEVLTAASAVVASRTPKDVLKCVRLTTTSEGLMISATDLEVGLRGLVRQVEIKVSGDCLLLADKLMQIVRESLDEALVIEADAERCHIRGQDSHYELYGPSPQDFPPVPDLDGEPDVKIEADALRQLIERTVFAVAKENTRYAINGVLWEKQPDRLVLVATDGRRLAWAAGAVENVSVGEKKQTIVPLRAVSVLQRVLANVSGSVAVQFTGNQVIIGGGNYVLSSALVEGHFPQYEEVLPKDNDKKIELSTEEFLSAVRRAAVLSNERSKGLRLRFEEDRLILSSRAPEQGESTVSMAVPYKMDPLEIGFNPLFLMDALRAVGIPAITLELRDASRPGLFRAGTSFLYLVMPVSLT